MSSTPSDKRVIIIAGPTAVGKTSAAIQLALHLQTEIISADSRQCYREMNIGVARPTKLELSQVPHHFIASHSIHDTVNAVVFEQYALHKLDELFQRYDTVVMVGGTGLYIRAFCEGLDNIPDVDPQIRANIIVDYEAKGLSWLQEQLKEKDPLYYHSGEIHNPQRLMRALEVKEATGLSIREYQSKQKQQRPFSIHQLGLELPREELNERIHLRVDQMMEQGQLEEVRSLLSYEDLSALQTVGYSELFEHIHGRSTLSQAIDKIKAHTRQYAKRQMTWFKRDPAIKWINAHEANALALMDIIGD